MATNRVLERERATTQLSVFAREFKVDTYLSSDIPLERLSRDVARVIAGHIDANGGDSGWLRHPDSEIVLNPPVGQNWDQHKTLRQLAVRDGTAAQLATRLANPRYPALVESQADATAAVRNEKFRPWDPRTGRRLTCWLFPCVIAAVMILGVIITEQNPSYTRWVLAAVGAVIAAVGITITAILGRDERSIDVAGASAACVYATAPTAVWLVMPTVNPLAFIAASTVMLTTSLVFIGMNFTPKSVHAAALICGLATVVGVGLIAGYNLWRTTGIEAYATTVGLIALIVGGYGHTMLAKSMARIIDPRLPDTGGDPVDVTSTADLLELSRTTMTQQARDAIVHQRDRIIQARFISMGLLVGTAITLTVSGLVAGVYVPFDASVRLVVFSTPVVWVTAVTIAVLCAALCLSSTWLRDRQQRAIGTVGAVIAWFGFLTGVLVDLPRVDVTFISVLLVGTVIVLAVPTGRSWATSQAMSHTARGRLQTLEKLLYALPVPLIATLLDLAHHIRHL